MTRRTLPRFWRPAFALAALIWLGLAPALAQQGEEPTTSKGENFSAKPPAQLFASDCTGAGCHKGPQGLSKGKFLGSLAGFLREHYTTSRESAAALANYLSKLPPEPKERETRTRRGTPASSERAGFTPEPRTARPPTSRASRTPAHREREEEAEKPASTARTHPVQERDEKATATPAHATPEHDEKPTARAHPAPESDEKPSHPAPHGHAVSASAATPSPAPTPPAAEAVSAPPPAAAPQVEAAPAPEPPAPAPQPPKKKAFDIFD